MTNHRGENPCSLITGGAGFIGSHVADYCLKLGHRVVVLDDLSGGFADQAPSGAELVVGSVTDSALLTAMFRKHRFDYVYHLAAYAAVGLSHFIRRFNYTTNLIGTVNLINEAVTHRTRCFVFASSISVYGEDQVPMTDDLVPRPADPYGISKYASELDLAAAFEQFGLPYIIFRPHNVYGERQNLGDPYRNVLGIFMNQIMEKRPLTIFGDGEQTRAFTHVEDVAPHIARCVDIPDARNQTINIGADQPWSVNALADLALKTFGSNLPVHHLPPRKEAYQVWATHERARKLLDAVPAVGLEEGLRRMADWARAKGIRKSRIFSGIEISRDLPPSWAALHESEFEDQAIPTEMDIS
jgi:UDP-glucose 4-epimerase